MNRKWISAIFLPLLGIICILAFAYGCTNVNQTLLAENQRVFDVKLIAIILWSNALATFLSIGATILLFWEIMTHTFRSKWIGWIFLILGTLLNLLPLIPVLLYIFFRIQAIDWGFLPTLLTGPAPNSPLYITEAVVAVTGLFILILPWSPSIDKDQPDKVSQSSRL